MQIRVYQVLDEQQLGQPDIHRLLSIHMAGAHSHGWEVFNVTEAVLDWLAGRRPNKGILVTCNTIFEQSVQVRFARRNEHHNSKQPILVLFDDEAKTRGHTTAQITELRPGKKQSRSYCQLFILTYFMASRVFNSGGDYVLYDNETKTRGFTASTITDPRLGKKTNIVIHT
jgi:hypothetical protein